MNRMMIGMAAFFSTWLLVAFAALLGPEQARGVIELGAMEHLQRLVGI